MERCDNKYKPSYGEPTVRRCQRNKDHKGQHSVVYKKDGHKFATIWDEDSANTLNYEGLSNKRCTSCGLRIKKSQHKNVCFRCDFWLSKIGDPRYMIIEGYSYTWGPERGHGGQLFSIEGLESGIVITQKGLWAQGKVPDFFREALPDTHKFLIVGTKFDGYGFRGSGSAIYEKGSLDTAVREAALATTCPEPGCLAMPQSWCGLKLSGPWMHDARYRKAKSNESSSLKDEVARARARSEALPEYAKPIVKKTN